MTDLRNNKETYYDYKLYIEGGPRPPKWDDDDDKQNKNAAAVKRFIEKNILPSSKR